MVDRTNALPRPRLLLVENSLHMTGAFGSALAMTDALRTDYEIEFVLPATSTLQSAVEAKGLVCHLLPMSELGRAWPRLLRYMPILLANTVRLRRLLSRQRIDVLLINDYYNLLGAMVKGTGWGGQLLTMVRLMPLNQHRVLNRVWTALAVRFSDKVVAVSRAVAKQLPPSSLVQVIYSPNRFDERYPSFAVEQVDGTVRCLYLANYIAGKGHFHAMQAFARAYVENPALRLRFVGGDMGLVKNRALKKLLEQTAVQMLIDKVVVFSGYSDDVEFEIKNADIVLNFSESESFSYTCLEACIFGRPIIATRCGGPEEIVDDGISGILVPVGATEKMQKAILALASAVSMRHSMGQAGHRIVRERFSEKFFNERFKSVINLHK